MWFLEELEEERFLAVARALREAAERPPREVDGVRKELSREVDREGESLSLEPSLPDIGGAREDPEGLRYSFPFPLCSPEGERDFNGERRV